MPEWSIGTVSKTVVPLRVPRVRIPVFPQTMRLCRNSVLFVCKEPILGPTAGGRRSQSAWTVDILIDGEKGGDKDIATPRWRLVALL